MLLKLNTFQCDVTSPVGHPLMFGGIPPAREIVDSQLAKGLILQCDNAPPVVLAVLDWCEIRNEGHVLFRQALAEAVGTSRDRVAVQCVHQHDSVYADPEAEKKLEACKVPTRSMNLEFFAQACRRVADSAAQCMSRPAETIDAVGYGQARVNKVASNRRIIGDDGNLLPMRGSACTEEFLREQLEGLIDPFLKTITLWSGGHLSAAMHYYATHPMSFYRQGSVSKDFCGLAREQIEQETGGTHLYFTGCAGNIAAGKYNDGSPEMRPVLRDRMLDAMREALENSATEPLARFDWYTAPVRLTPRAEFTRQWYLSLLQDESATHNVRYRGAAGLTFLDRIEAGCAIDFTCLCLNETRVLHLPGEPFIEYQLFAQQEKPQHFVAVAGYGDCGPGYIPTDDAYALGGYEAGPPALVGPPAEAEMRSAIHKLLQMAG
jgi:hypothetical protein